MTGEPTWPPRRSPLHEAADDLEQVLNRLRERDPTPHADKAVDDRLFAAGEHYRRCRSRREPLFDDDEDPADPAWDILVDLYLRERAERKTSVSGACIASLVAPTTALRWIARLHDAGLVLREKDGSDRRVSLVRLSSTGEAKVRDWLACLAGLPGGGRQDRCARTAKA